MAEKNCFLKRHHLIHGFSKNTNPKQMRRFFLFNDGRTLLLNDSIYQLLYTNIVCYQYLQSLDLSHMESHLLLALSNTSVENS
jgi:hypothetical protein